MFKKFIKKQEIENSENLESVAPALNAIAECYNNPGLAVPIVDETHSKVISREVTAPTTVQLIRRLNIKGFHYFKKENYIIFNDLGVKYCEGEEIL